jgi:hypothetical protein
VPLFAVVEPVMEGLETLLVKLFGPVHDQLTPLVVDVAFKMSVLPLHKGLLPVIAGVAGV